MRVGAGVVSAVLCLALVVGCRAAGDSEETAPEPLAVVETEAAYMAELFDDGWDERWVASEASKEGAAEEIARYNGMFQVDDVEGRPAFVAADPNKHYAMSRRLDAPFQFAAGKLFVLQFEVTFKKPLQCGGAYIKLLSTSDALDLKGITDKTPYTILFGPDKCGRDSHFRFIYRFKNPKTGEYREVHTNPVPSAHDKLFKDAGVTHLVRLVLRPSSTFGMWIDGTLVGSGSLTSSDLFDPPLMPAETVNDETDKKPSDWVDHEMMDDPADPKPSDWDEDAPRTIPDPEATMPEGWDESAPTDISDPGVQTPEDWDVEMDGEWQAPMIPNPVCQTGCGPWEAPRIPNPAYRGKWRAKQVKNPAYKGEWKAKQLANPAHFKEPAPFSKLDGISAAAFELWTITEGIAFSSVLITSSLADADAFADAYYVPKWTAQLAAVPTPFSERVLRFLNEKIVEAAEQPYLYAVYVAVFAIPAILLRRLLMTGQTAEPAAASEQAAPSQTASGEEGGEEEEEGGEAAAEAAASPKKTATL